MSFARLEQKLIDGVVSKSRLAIKGVIRRGVLVPPTCATGTFDIRDVRPFAYDVLSHLALVHDEIFEQLGEMQVLATSQHSDNTGTFVAHVVGTLARAVVTALVEHVSRRKDVRNKCVPASVCVQLTAEIRFLHTSLSPALRAIKGNETLRLLMSLCDDLRGALATSHSENSHKDTAGPTSLCEPTRDSAAMNSAETAAVYVALAKARIYVAAIALNGRECS